MHGSDFCYLHNPNISEATKRTAQAKGGSNTRIVQQPLSPVSINNVKDVISLLGGAINEVRDGSLDIKAANCIGYLSGHLVKAMEISDLEERMEKLETELMKKR